MGGSSAGPPLPVQLSGGALSERIGAAPGEVAEQRRGRLNVCRRGRTSRLVRRGRSPDQSEESAPSTVCVNPYFVLDYELELPEMIDGPPVLQTDLGQLRRRHPCPVGAD